MEKRPPIWRVCANILNKQSQTADKVRSSSLGLGEALTAPHHKNIILRNSQRVSLGPGLILWSNLSSEKGAKREEVTGERIKLYNEELNDLYCSLNIVRVIKSRRMRWAGHLARMGERRGVYRVLVGKPEGKRPLGR